jgi:hypothetical protein
MGLAAPGAVTICLTALILAGCQQAAAPSTGEPTATAAPQRAAQTFRSPLDHPVLAWNETFLASIRTRPPRPTVITRQLFMAQAAIYDAWAAHDATATPLYLDAGLRRPAAARDEANKRTAIAHAAYGIAAHFFPEDLAAYKDTAERLDIALDPDSRDPATPEGIGNLAAEAVIAGRAEDGSNWRNGYADTTGYGAVNRSGPDALEAADFDPNRWQPLLVPTGAVLSPDGVPTVTEARQSYKVQKALTPQWGTVTPFGLRSGDEFRPPPPPQYGDHRPYVDANGHVTTGHLAWRDQFGELMLMSGWLDDPETGPRWKCIAEFWADGPRTETPPGHWNQLAHGFVLRDNLGIDETVKLYLALTGALLDAAIAVWDAKYYYDFIRPQSAIRYGWSDQTVLAWAGPNRGVHPIRGSEWQPYQEATFVTPAFPEYVSGHSAFSMAAATVLKQILGSDRFYDPDNPTTIGLDIDDEPGPDILGRHVIKGLKFENYDGPPMTLIWPTITAAANEAGISRLYGGIHIQDANLRGQEVGRAVGERAVEVARGYF